jgi:hypothetical protein
MCLERVLAIEVQGRWDSNSTFDGDVATISRKPPLLPFEAQQERSKYMESLGLGK